MLVCLHPHIIFRPFVYGDALSGKVYGATKAGEIPAAVSTFRYYAGWADKVQGKTIEVRPHVFKCWIGYQPTRCAADHGRQIHVYTTRALRRSGQSMSVCSRRNAITKNVLFQGQIIPWNFPLVRCADQNASYIILTRLPWPALIVYAFMETWAGPCYWKHHRSQAFRINPFDCTENDGSHC